jgi:uncharacterized protein (TIGR00725 family)
LSNRQKFDVFFKDLHETRYTPFLLYRRRLVIQYKFVAVIGGSNASKREIDLAEEVGSRLASRGITVISGGLGGVMEAASRGATKKGGVTVGILPGDTRGEANEYIKIPIVTGLGHSRNSIVVRSAQAIIAIGGAYGTLSEIAFALQYNIPIISLGTWSLNYKGKRERGLIEVESPEEAVDLATELGGISE